MRAKNLGAKPELTPDQIYSNSVTVGNAGHTQSLNYSVLGGGSSAGSAISGAPNITSGVSAGELWKQLQQQQMGAAG